MCNRSVNGNPSKFHIKLLADKSVVLVEIHGYESEIFLPEVQDGRICLTNVLCDRQPTNQTTDVLSHSALHQCPRLSNRKLTSATAGLAAKKVVPKLRFELKLISNGNVVLVQRNGYESEIFLPHIISHCIVMKRVCADELAQCAIRNSMRSQIQPLATTDKIKLLVNPKDKPKRNEHKSQTAQMSCRELDKQKEKLVVVKQKKRHIKHQSKAAGDA